jgi:hypothetical protein
MTTRLDMCAALGGPRDGLPLEHYLPDQLVDREHPPPSAGPDDDTGDPLAVGTEAEPRSHVDHLERVAAEDEDGRSGHVVHAPVGERQRLLDAVHRHRPQQPLGADDQDVDRLAHLTLPRSRARFPGQSTAGAAAVGRIIAGCRSPICPSPASVSST